LGVGDPRVCERVVGVDLDRTLEVLDAPRRVDAAPVVAPADVGLVRLHVDGLETGQARALLRGHLHLDLIRDRAGHLALQREDIPRAPLVAVGPQVVVAGSVDQLGGDAHRVAHAHHRALDNGVH
jgi:hypothetical protein